MLQTEKPEAPPRITALNQIRKKIEHYSFSLNDKIGKGFTSTVYRGRNDLTGQTVAIKVIQLKSLKDHVTRNLLQTELQCIKKINHQYLLKYIDSYETANNCYIITEFCEGGDLEKQLRVKGRFTEAELVTFFAQFYTGYQSFLSSGFIHRDLKPANIFLKGKEIRIADFGMIKKLSENPKDNYNVGTPVYMPPESMLSNIYSQKSDVWSIGVMCYQLTHGVLPWKGANEQQLKTNIQTQKVQFDTSLVSLDLIKFISQCLDKNPSTRLSILDMRSQPWMQKVLPYINLQSKPLSQPLTKQPSLNQLLPNFYLQTTPISHTPLVITKRSSTTSFTHNSTPKPILHNNVSFTLLAPMHNIPALSISDLSQHAHTANNKSMKSERPTMDSEQASSIARQKRKASVIENKVAHRKSTLDYLVSILNYLRYLYKVFRKVQEVKQSQNIQPSKQANFGAIERILINELIAYMKAQQGMIRNKDNIYELAQWDQFKVGNKWSTYAGVVKQYCHKYNKIHQQWQNKNPTLDQPNPAKLPQSLKPIINQLSTQVRILARNPKPEPHLFELIELVDYLCTVHNLEEVIGIYGWSTFVDKSPINSIVECKCHVDQHNYRDIWDKLENKIRKIVVQVK